MHEMASAPMRDTDNAALLSQFLESHTNSLTGILRTYVYKAGLAHESNEIEEAAFELLSEVVIEAFKSGSRYLSQSH